MSDKDEDLIRKNKLTGLAVLGAVIAMIALSFAAVPMYTLFCRVTGFGGTTRVADALPGQVVDREVTVLLNADTASDLFWDFYPEQRQVSFRLGERALVSFKARNNDARKITGTSLFNVTPPKAGKYFHKIECFCFGEQILQPGEEARLPVVFYVDPAMNKDPALNDVKTITLSYTFFKTESAELDQGLEDFYNQAAPASGG